MMQRLVVSTGGGAVIRPINWYKTGHSNKILDNWILSLLLSCLGGVICFIFIFRKHMQKGISVWLDVPLEALARRIAAVGTGSRPLLHQEAGDAYSKVGHFIHHIP
ncbi:hypothetical protein CsSME_00002804 [Camellia sinensis var. sinensis]